MSSAYERVKDVVDRLETRYYDLLEACDEYADLLETLTAEEEAADETNGELLRRYAHQHREVDELRERLEAGPMETLLRIIDRVTMIKATEEGTFL